MIAPASLTLGALLGEMAERLPGNLAIADTARVLTFGDLAAESAVSAKGLLALGVGRGDVVSILGPNTVQWMSVVMGALRIGAVLAPLNTWYKAKEIRHSLEHSRTKCLFAAARLRSQNFDRLLTEALPDLSSAASAASGSESAVLRHLVQFERTLPAAIGYAEFAARGAAVSDAALAAAESAVQPEDVAFILYTSGSTSDPKGVLLHHGAAIANDFQIGERIGLVPGDRIWLGSPLFYGFALVNAIPAAWTHGAGVLVQEYFDPEIAIRLMASHRATGYYGFGNMTRAIVANPSFAGADLSSLSKGLTGFSPEDKRLAIEELGVRNCCSMYGLTESYGNCTVTEAADPIEVKLETQGRKLPGWDLKIVDPESERPLEAGVVGHLLIRGHISTGYYRNPQATRAAFDNEGYFRTGDLASIGADGRLRFHSRLKEVLKVGGINVSPHEVEDALHTHDSVQQAYVVGIPDEIAGEAVVAFVDCGGKQLEAEALRRFVRERVASFKVPRHIVFCTEASLPRLSTGKVPRYRLREMAIELLIKPSTARIA